MNLTSQITYAKKYFNLSTESLILRKALLAALLFLQTFWHSAFHQGVLEISKSYLTKGASLSMTSFNILL